MHDLPDRRFAERKKHRHGTKGMMRARRSRASSAISLWTARGCHIALSVTTADVTDRKGLLQALQEAGPQPGRVQKNLLCDGGHTGRKPFEQRGKAIPGEEATVQIAQRSELCTFEVMRWRKTGDHEKTANESATPVCNSLIWHSFP